MTRRSNKKSFEHIVITGASSGIGEALALHYASRGVSLALTGRDQDRLNAVADACRQKGAQLEVKVVDVTDREGMAQWLTALDARLKIDLIFANAGISAGTGEEDFEGGAQVRAVFDVNVTGVLNTIEPILPRMVRDGRGHIAIMSSLAGFRGLPGAPAYAGSKAAVRVYGESLGSSLADTGVQVHVVCPGFVRSRMTDVNTFPMPFLMSAEKAARIISRGIERGKARISFPLPMVFAVWLLAAVPDRLARIMVKKTPSKPKG